MKGYTLVEVLVVLAIVAALCGLLVPAIMAAREHAGEERRESTTSLLHSVTHDGHLWVMGWSIDGCSHATHFVHHPDCPCSGRQAERGDQ